MRVGLIEVLKMHYFMMAISWSTVKMLFDCVRTLRRNDD